MQQCYSPDFTHYKQSVRVVEKLEKDGEGLNLTWEVRDGILNHTGSCMASTLEGVIVKFADRIAYINHDIDDARYSEPRRHPEGAAGHARARTQRAHQPHGHLGHHGKRR